MKRCAPIQEDVSGTTRAPPARMLTPASDAPLTATLGEILQDKEHRKHQVTGERDDDAIGWRDRIMDRPFVALAAAVAVGLTATLLIRRLLR